MHIFSPEAFFIYLSVFGVAWFSGVFGMGGGIILLGVLTLFLPVEILVPVHGLLVIISIAPRALFNWRHIHWPLVGKCSVGIVFGAFIGASINTTLPLEFFYSALGCLMLAIVWLPGQKDLNIPMLPASFAHGIISALFGTGGILQAIFARMNITRHTFIATFAAIMFISMLGRTSGYWWHGFDVSAYMGVVLCAVAPSIMGGFIGKKCLDKLPEILFQRIFKILITVLALRLLIIGLYTLLSA